MRTTITGTWLFGLVAVFIILFSSYLALSVNYAKVFKVKNGVVSIIEKNEGFNDVSKEKIESYLNSSGYNIYGRCPSGWETPITNGSGRSKYCVKEEPGTTPGYDTVYYHVILFFKFDVPVLGNILTFKIPGYTKEVYLFS